MGLLILGSILGLIAVLFGLFGKGLVYSTPARALFSGLALIISIMMIVFSTSVHVDDKHGALVIKVYGGEPLKEGHIVALNGENGVQADVLPQGWSFGWAPWKYTFEEMENFDIPEGKVGLVTALDGAPLPAGEVYAPAWDSPSQMLDAKTFLTSKTGYRGPQVTVLPPSKYRYNNRLFTVTLADVTDVQIGEVAVIKANVGKLLLETNCPVVNGVPLVSEGTRGLWNKALLPNKFYMHPNAYQIVKKAVTKKMYSYTSSGTVEATSKADRPHINAAIPTRSKDGYSIPVDVRITASVKAEDAPYVVALFGNPDLVSSDGYETIETLAILPSIRALLRNAAQNEGALDFVMKREQIEKEIFEKFAADMAKDKIQVEAVYLAEIGLASTEEGKALLKTQTDKQLADQQKDMYAKQTIAEQERANQVKAKVAAEQQEKIQISLAEIEASSNGMITARNKALGEAAQSLTYEAKVKAVGGPENFIKLEVAKMIVDKVGAAIVAQGWPTLPQTLVTGGSGSGSGQDGLITGMIANLMKNTPALSAVVSTNVAGK